MYATKHLQATAIGFGLIGIVLIFFGSEYRLIGGIATTGICALVFQFALSLFFVDGVALREPVMVEPMRRHDRSGSVMAPVIELNPRRALLRFYIRRPLPAMCLSFGLSSSITTISIGLFNDIEGFTQNAPDWIPFSARGMLTILVISSLAQIPFLQPGILGWSAGFALGALLGDLAFNPINSDSTPGLWFFTVVGIWLIWGVVKISEFSWRWWTRRRARRSTLLSASW